MADVDGIWHHAGLYRFCRVHESDASNHPGFQLEAYAGVDRHSVSLFRRADPLFTFIHFELTLPSPFFVCIQVYMCPESPRWYMIRDRYQDAYNALCKLRPSEFQAARDLYYIHSALKVEEKLRQGKHLWREMFTVPRNRRAAQSSFFVMFMQQVRLYGDSRLILHR